MRTLLQPRILVAGICLLGLLVGAFFVGRESRPEAPPPNQPSAPALPALADRPVPPPGQSPDPPAEQRRAAPAFQAGLGLDGLLRSATGDSWALRVRANYARTDPTHSKAIEAAVAQARRDRAGRNEVRVDTDVDGTADFRVYFVGDEPAFVEADRFGCGCLDLRIDLRTEEWRAQETKGWFLEPPVPTSEPAAPGVPAELIFDAAFPATVPAGVPRPAEKLAVRLFPDIEGQLKNTARGNADMPAAAELANYVAQAAKLHPRFAEEFRKERFAEKTKTRLGFRIEVRPYDLDGKQGSEVAAGYAPWGVDHVAFYRSDWLKHEELLAQCVFDGGEVTQVDLGGRRYVRLGAFWGRVAPEARAEIARRFLVPGFRDYHAGDIYAALIRWRHATELAALAGDLGRVIGPDGRLDNDAFTDRIDRERWEFTADGRPAAALFQFARCIAWRYKPGLTEAIAELAEDAFDHRRYEDALSLLRLKTRFADKLDSPLSKTNALDRMGQIYLLLGSHDRALECLFQALDLESTLGYAAGVVRNLEFIRQGDDDPDEPRRVMAIRSTAMAVNRGCKLAAIASLYADLGELDKAETYASEADRLLGNLEHRYGEADLLNIRARLDLARGRWELALQRLERALRITEQQLQAPEELDKRGRVLDAGKARHRFRLVEPHQLFEITMASPSHPLSYRALTAGQMGEAYLQGALAARATDVEKARRLLTEAEASQQRALGWYREAADDLGVLVSRLRLATLALHRGEPRQALTEAAAVETAARRDQLFELTWRACALQGAAHKALGESDQAVARYEAAAKEVESVRALIRSEPARRGFFSSKLEIYEELAALHAAAGRDEKVWECMERAKARALLDVIAGQDLPVKGSAVVQAAREMPLLLQQLRGVAGPGGAPSAARLEKDYEAVLAKVADQPHLQEVTSLRAVLPADRKAVAAALGPDELLIEFFETATDLYVAVVATDGMKVHTVAGYGRAELTRDAERFRRELQDDRSTAYAATARRLYQRLVAPYLAGRDRLAHLHVVPAGALHYLPFHALLDGDRFLIERCLVSYSSSASALVYAARRGERRANDLATLIVAEPRPATDALPLPHAAIEGRRVHRLAPDPKRLLEGEKATETTVRDELPRAKVFHFAGHTHSLPGAPMRSALQLTPDADHDGRLEVRDLFGLDLRGCELAVLSACETQVGPWSRGDEIVSLQRAFLRAGAPAVVASLWMVPDEPTSRLMVRFHEHLNRPGTSRVEALALAQREFLTGQLTPLALDDDENRLLDASRRERGLSRGLVLVAPALVAETGTRPHPYLWAAFGLWGDGR